MLYSSLVRQMFWFLGRVRSNELTEDTSGLARQASLSVALVLRQRRELCFVLT